MDGEARTSAAIYFLANNARVNRRGETWTRTRALSTTLFLSNTSRPHSRVPSGQRGRTANEISRDRRRETSREENTRDPKRGKRAKKGWQRMDGRIFFAKCDLRSLVSFSSDVYCNDDISSNKMMSNDVLNNVLMIFTVNERH